MDIINIATLIAYVAFAMDTFFQIHRVWARKSSADISSLGLGVRIAAGGIIWIKLLLIGDVYLLIGHSALVLLLAAYFVLVLRYNVVS